MRHCNQIIVNVPYRNVGFLSVRHDVWAETFPTYLPITAICVSALLKK